MKYIHVLGGISNWKTFPSSAVEFWQRTHTEPTEPGSANLTRSKLCWTVIIWNLFHKNRIHKSLVSLNLALNGIKVCHTVQLFDKIGRSLPCKRWWCWWPNISWLASWQRTKCSCRRRPAWEKLDKNDMLIKENFIHYDRALFWEGDKIFPSNRISTRKHFKGPFK